MEESKMKKHVTVVAAIQVGFGLLGLMLSVFFFNFARTHVGDEPVACDILMKYLLIGLKSILGDEVMASDILRIISISIPMLIGFLSTLGLIGGIGLFAYKQWARYLVIVVAALGCLNIPIGTLKGVYFLWVLLQNDTIKLFEEK